MDNEMLNVFSQLDELLGKQDLSNVTSEGSGFENLPDGYYLCEVKKAEIKSTKETKMPMVSFQFEAIENGKSDNFVEAENGNHAILWKEIPKTAKRMLFQNYVLKDERSVKRFVSDMLKFEDPGEVGIPILPMEAFTTSELLSESLECLIGLTIYVKIETTETKDGQKSTWQNLVSWNRAAKLELPLI